MSGRRWATAFGFLAAMALSAAPAFSQRIRDVSSLPDWTTVPRPELGLLVAGSPRSWDLAPRGPAKAGGKPPALPEAAGVSISVGKDAGLTLTVTATRGLPVIFIADGPLHPFDRDAAFLAPEGEPLPGNPVAFAMGAAGRASISLVPATDGVWRVWIWVLRGGLEAPPAEETDPETLKTFEAMGFTAHQMALLGSEPDFVRAWRAGDGDVVVGKADQPAAWASSRVEVSVSPGPKDAPRPQMLLRARQAELSPKGQETSFRDLQKWQKAVDELATLRGEAIAWARARAGAESVLAGGSVQDAVDGLASTAKHPDILEALLRRDNERRRWSAKTLAASGVLELSRSVEAERSVLPTRASRTLARLLRGAGAIDAVVIDRGGEILAATGPGVLPALVKQPGWDILDNASGNEPLATAPFEIKGLGFLARKIAAPVLDATGTRLIGWILAEVYAGPLPR